MSSAKAEITSTPTDSHMPATVTQGPEPQILYEPCVRPSGVRTSQRSPCSQTTTTADASSTICRRTQVVKSMQTTVTAAEGTTTRLDQNEEVHSPEIGEGSEHYWSSELTPLVITDRSDSRDSLSTWPPTSEGTVAPVGGSEQYSKRLRKQAKKRPLTASKPSLGRRSIGTNTMLIIDAAQHPQFSMPHLDWSPQTGSRIDRPARRAVKKLTDYVLWGSIVLILSTLMQWSYLAYHCQTAGYYDVRDYTIPSPIGGHRMY